MPHNTVLLYCINEHGIWFIQQLRKIFKRYQKFFMSGLAYLYSSPKYDENKQSI